MSRVFELFLDSVQSTLVISRSYFRRTTRCHITRPTICLYWFASSIVTLIVSLSVGLSFCLSGCLAAVFQNVSSPAVLVGIRRLFNTVFSYVVTLLSDHHG